MVSLTARGNIEDHTAAILWYINITTTLHYIGLTAFFQDNQDKQAPER